MEEEEKQDPTILMNQARSLVQSLARYNLSSRIPDAVVSHSCRLYDMAKKIFGEEVRILVVHPPQTIYGYPVAGDVLASVESLLHYLQHKMGDPVASELVGDTVGKARWALKENLPVCAVLLCRVAQEQTMRRLCDRIGIEYAPDTQPGTLADKLRQENGGPFEKHVWMAVKAKLSYEGQVLHDRAKPDIEEVTDLIDWTDKFISRLDTASGRE